MTVEFLGPALIERRYRPASRRIC